jgi:hypothetical protein
MQDGEGEENVVELLPFWDNQVIRIREAFGRKMAPDPVYPVKDVVIYVKSAAGSPPEPTFERMMSYPLGNDPKEYQFRIQGETPQPPSGRRSKSCTQGRT